MSYEIEKMITSFVNKIKLSHGKNHDIFVNGS